MVDVKPTTKSDSCGIVDVTLGPQSQDDGYSPDVQRYLEVVITNM